jgi:RNA polymerase sigma-70 factor, ECF subfamily
MQGIMANINFDDVYAANKGRVWGLVSRYVYTKEDREDLFQEIFINVHRALPRFRGDSSVNTWVFRVAVNTALNHVKKQSRYRLLKQTLGALRIFDHDPVAEGSDLKEFKPLEKLNPQQRMVLILSDVEERKLEEIAETMGLPVGTVKSNLFRAREIVKKEVMENGEAYGL